MMLSSAERLQKAGADFLIRPDNTVHPAVDLICDRLPLPWLHIAEEVGQVARSRGFRRLLLLGTKYLMEGPVYGRKLGPLAIDDDLPEPGDRERINTLIFEELVRTGASRLPAAPSCPRSSSRASAAGQTPSCSGARRSRC